MDRNTFIKLFIGLSVVTYLLYQFVWKTDTDALLRDCVTQSDLACVARVAVDLNSSKIKHGKVLYAAQTAAYLGDIETAMKVRDRQSDQFDRARIISAITAYYVAVEQTEKLEKFWAEVEDPVELIVAIRILDGHIRLGSGAMRTLVDDLFIQKLTELAPSLQGEKAWSWIAGWNIPDRHVDKFDKMLAESQAEALYKRLKEKRRQEKTHPMVRIRADIVSLAKSGDADTLRAYINDAIASKIQKAAFLGRSYSVEHVASELFQLESIRSLDRASAAVLSQSLIDNVDFTEKGACIAFVYQSVAKLLGRIGFTQDGLKLIDIAETYAPDLNGELLGIEDCPFGYKEQVISSRAALGDRSKLKIATPELKSRIVNGKSSYWLHPLLLGGLSSANVFAEPEDRKLILKTYMKLQFYAGNLSTKVFEEAIAHALYAGDTELAFAIAQDLVNTLDNPRNKRAKTSITEAVIDAFIDNGFGTGWLMYHGKSYLQLKNADHAGELRPSLTETGFSN